MLGEALTIVAPYYNMVLVIIALFFFAKLFFEAKPTAYLKPWKVMLAATLVFIVEEVITILRQAEVINVPFHVNGFFELVIVSLIIYLLLLQKEYAGKFMK